MFIADSLKQKVFVKLKNILLPAERRSLVYQAILDFIFALMDIAFLAALVLLVQSMVQGASPEWMPGMVSRHPLAAWSVFILLYAIKNYLAFGLARFQYHFVYRIAARLSASQLDHFFGQEYEAFVRTDSSVYTRSIGQQPVELAHYVLRGMQVAVGQAMLVLLSAIGLLVYDARLFFLLFALLLPPLLMVGRMIKRNASEARQGARKEGEQTLRFLKEALSGFVESRIYFKKEFFISRYARSQEKMNAFLARQQEIQALPSRLLEVFALLGLFLLMAFSYLLYGNAASFLTLGAFLAAASRIIPGLAKMLNGWGQARTYSFVLDSFPVSRKEEHKEPAEDETLHSIGLEHVAFSFGHKKIFSDLHFQLKPGDFLGVKGISGKGKSTLVNLLLGFYQPSSGQVLLNGKILHTTMRSFLWKRTAYVKQQPYFIHDSAINNVVLGGMEADEEQLLRAEQFSGFLSVLNGNSSKVLSENGRNISGGQRQRIALARALYKDFDLLVLDEPFSELDEGTASGFSIRLRELADKGKIIVMISHNDQLLKHCTQTLSLDEV